VSIEEERATGRGVRDAVLGVDCRLYDAHPETPLVAQFADAAAGAVVATRDGAILRRTIDGAVWITHLTRVEADPRATLKLPAVQVLGNALAGVPDVPLAVDAASDAPTWRPVRYEERGHVGVLHFAFYNGAMSTSQCNALRAAVAAARARPVRVLVLAGGPDFWSNGIHLNVIEASPHPAEESWRNIEAMNDLVLEILSADGLLTVAAMQGNAGAGGCFLALAADRLRAVAGAIDVSVGTRTGKKGRIVADFRVLARVGAAEAVADACFAETSTLGLRIREERRRVLSRREVDGDAGGTTVRVKVAHRPGGTMTAKAAHDDVAATPGLAARRRTRTAAEARAIADANAPAPGATPTKGAV